MKLNFTIDTDDLLNDGDGYQKSFEDLLTENLRREIVANAKDELAKEQFHKFSELASNALIAEIKLRLQNFLSEEIALTDQWGKKTFVGSVDDLIKQRFDDVILRPVDSSGQTLQGCTSVSHTWIEWQITKNLEETRKRIMKDATDHISRIINENVKAMLIEIKEEGIKDRVKTAFVNLLQNEK